MFNNQRELKITTMPRTKPPQLLPLSALQQAAECLGVLAHPHRLRIVQMLLASHYTVGEIAEACEIAPHMASQHLRLMQRCGFLAVTKQGRNRYYRIVEPHLKKLMACVEGRFGSRRA